MQTNENSTIPIPRPATLARGGAALSTLSTGFLAGAVVGLLNGDRREGANVATALAGALALPLAGVRLDVCGEKHLWSHRPAVFILNHQSALDVFVMARLLQRDFATVAKKELARNPVVGPMAWLLGSAFVDRSNTARAVSALQPVVDLLNDNVSIAIFPEGTRTSSTTLGPFKKGAFQMAMQAGVPIVPIVIRNARELMPNGSLAIRPGTIDVIVHPPVATTDWQPNELEARIEQVRDLYVKTLMSN